MFANNNFRIFHSLRHFLFRHGRAIRYARYIAQPLAKLIFILTTCQHTDVIHITAPFLKFSFIT